MKKISLHIIETPENLEAVEELQRQVWPSSEVDIVPAHMLLASIDNGGLLIGAYDAGETVDQPEESQADEIQELSTNPDPIAGLLVGFVYGFPAFYDTPDGLKLKHHSHMLGVRPEYRDQGIGFLLKRAQWQMVRHQSLEQITWTYDPLLSRNAHLNIARLGAVCSTYFPNYYGEMRDEMNIGISSDRFQVDWWINSKRVMRRLSKRPRLKLDLAHFLAAGIPILNPTRLGSDGLPRPDKDQLASAALEQSETNQQTLLLVEIPSDFLALKASDFALAKLWREHTRAIFKALFANGYLVTDFVHLPGTYPRSFYTLSHGDSTL